jgi:hypothetical protein
MANNPNPTIQQLIETAETTDEPLRFLIHNFVERYSPIQLIIMDRHPAFYPVFEAALDRMIELGIREQWMDYLLAKGIKIHGGINQYVIDFLNEQRAGINVLDYILGLPESARKDLLIESTTTEMRKMLRVDGLTADNRARIQAAIDRLNPLHPGAAAPAAGGGLHRARRRHRRRATRRRRRRSNRS